MIKQISFIVIFFLNLATTLGQEANDTHIAQDSKEDSYIEHVFHSPVLINSQTPGVLHKKSMEIILENRFGRINPNASGYGFSSPPNFRIGLAYGFTDWSMLSIGFIRSHSIVDVGYKFALLRQTTSDKMPVSVSFYGNVSVNMGHSEEFHQTADRISIFEQVIVSRKFGKNIAFFIAPGFMHFNEVDTSICYIHDSFLIAAGGQIKILPHTSLILEYGQGHLTNKVTNLPKAEPGVSLGAEYTAQKYSFQLFATTFHEISEQDNYMYNSNDFLKGQMLIGFNLTGVLDFKVKKQTTRLKKGIQAGGELILIFSEINSI